MKRFFLWLPLAMFALFLVVVAGKLRQPGDATIRSHMIGKAIPEFALQPAVPGRAGLSASDLRAGRPRLINVFASWCIPCRAEAAQLEALKRRGVPIDGIAIRDRPEDVAAFLRENGDPFDRLGADPRSQVQFALGSSGVPETFLVDGRGIIRLQHIGDIRPEEVGEIYAAWERAK
jgi:cytochrome c biogenesis protein CcmG/thiol:disulfide interchange protein DsbE